MPQLTFRHEQVDRQKASGMPIKYKPWQIGAIHANDGLDPNHFTSPMPVNPVSGGLSFGELADRRAFPHGINTIDVLGTHISWVNLTRPFAHKIRKPARFDFVDYSTPDSQLPAQVVTFPIHP